MCDPAPVDLRHHNALINMWNMLEAGSKPIRERIKDKADVRGYQVVRRISDIVGDWITLCDHMAGLCCTNPVRDSSRESSVIAGVDEQTEQTDLQDPELARV